MPHKPANALLHGTLDALILKTLSRGPTHGYAIARFIEDATGVDDLRQKYGLTVDHTLAKVKAQFAEVASFAGITEVA